MDVYVVDGTYELFRHYFGVPKQEHEGQEIAATRGVLATLISMLEDGVRYLGVATDHSVESFRNEMWAGYKDSSMMEPDILSQFPLLEEAIVALGVRLWPMIEYEADDALASAALLAAADESVEHVYICSPDKDLSQSVVGDRVLQFDRRKNEVRDADGVRAKFGVGPESIADYLALVGDSADGFPGLRGWGAKTASVVLGRYEHLEQIPTDAAQWEVNVRGAEKRAQTLVEERELAELFRDLATLRTDVPVFDWIDDLRWMGPTPAFGEVLARLQADGFAARIERLLETLD